MGKAATLLIKIISDAKNATKGFDESSKAAASWQSNLSKASAAASVALAAVGAAAWKMGESAAEDAAQQAVLAKSMTNAAGASKKQIAATEEWIDAQARATGIADDQLRPSLGALVRATGDVSTAQSALKVAMDVATATGKPLQSVSDALSKAYGGQTTSLGKLVPGMDKAILASGDMDKIMAELARTTGGSAAAAADTASGKWQRAKLAFSETAESLGTVLLPIISTAGEKMAGLSGFIDRNRTAVIAVTATFVALAAAVVTVNAAVTAYAAITKALTAIQAAYNAVLALNPIMLIVLAVIALVAALVIAYQKSETFRNIVDAVGRACAAAFGWIVDKVKSVASWLGEKVPAAANTMKSLVVGYIDTVTWPIQTLVGWISDLVSWIGKIKWPKPPGWLKSAAGWVGLGGPPPGEPGGGGRGVAYSSYGGQGGPTGAGFALPYGTGQAAPGVVIVINGAIDPASTADQVRKILRRRDVQLGAAS
ncbi:MAG: hypothetical protein QM597_06765 [Aeromicrobium sp.]|uniref:hypothetical protein n=1 Tax=Aeromicrobium sp. TaxID=1871063 RepID=UPI0039E23627